MVWAGPENYFIPFFYRAWRNKTSFNDHDLNQIIRFHEAFGILQPYVGFRFDKEIFLSNKNHYRTFNDIIEGTYKAFSDDLNKDKTAKIFINKNPLHSLYLWELKRLNPDSKFIWMVRDYRANVHSRKKSIHLKTDNAYENTLRWNHFNKCIQKFAFQSPNSILLVTYEELVNNPDLILQNISNFLGIDEMGDFREAFRLYQESYKSQVFSQYATSDRMKKRFGDFAKPIHSEATAQWKNGLTIAEIEICEVLSGKFASTFGYEANLKVSGLRRFSILTTAVFYRLKIRLTLIKDFIFNRLPIRVKLIYFIFWVNRMDQKRKANVSA